MKPDAFLYSIVLETRSAPGMNTREALDRACADLESVGKTVTLDIVPFNQVCDAPHQGRHVFFRKRPSALGRF